MRVVVDAAAGRHPISPYIYGVAFGSSHALEDMGTVINRAGGDSAARYNWESNARAAGRDWFFESMPCDNSPMEQFGDNFVAMSKAGGAVPMLTVPMVGWVAKLGPNRERLAGFSILKYGLQQKTDVAGLTTAGDGVAIDGSLIHNNDPNDANVPDSLARETTWVKHVVTKWEPASKGGVRFFMLDNEPERWHDIHRDVHPVGTHANELAEKTLTFAKMVKSVDPSAKVVAPETWVPPGFHDSGFDQQMAELKDESTPRDRATQTGGMDMLPWLLTQWKKVVHPVDVVSVHFYPQSGEYRDGGSDVSESMQLLRNRSTRLLWDKSYHDTPWMSDMIGLIPRMREWVDRYYVPGTPIAITEYNWGGEKSMNGATTQADILGIFGREGLYMGTRWVAPADGSPTYFAMKLFRNYDDHHAGFGETSVSTAAPDADDVSAFGALRSSDRALTVMVINKQLHKDEPLDVAIKNFAPAGTVDAVRLVGGKLMTLPAGTYSNGVLHESLPAQSVTLLILHTSASPHVH